MKLFEATFRKGYECFERYYDTDLQKSVSKRIDIPYEWYEPSSTGLYEFILDKNIKLDKKQGRAKDGKDHYGFLDPMYRNIRDNYWNKNSFNMEPRVWYLDIETRSGTVSKGFPVPEKALEPISLMQIYDSKLKTMIILGLRDWKHQDEYKFGYQVKYIKCNDEIHLIQTYDELFKRCDPLIIYAWFGYGFDFPYIYNRKKLLGLDVQNMSNYGGVTLTQEEHEGQIEFKFKADGHFYIDLQVVYKKFELKPRPNYKLDTIAEIELKKNKVQHTEFATFDDFYTGKYITPFEPTEEQKNSKIYQAAIAGDFDEVKERCHSDFCFYGSTDTYLLKEIDDKKNFTAIMCMIAEKMGVQIGDSLGTVKPWSQYIANKSMLNMQVMPFREEHDRPDVVGGYVKDPLTGKHRWVLSGDANSMYPLLGMVGSNMSPETFISKANLPPELRDIVLTYFNNQDEEQRFDISDDVWDTISETLVKYNVSLAINGAVFDKSKLGMIPELVLEIYFTRKAAKAKMFKYEQRKILIGEILKEKQHA